MALNPIPILRIVQGVLAILVLGLTAYVVTEYNRSSLGSPNEANFMIWNCVWTFLALLYLGLAPTYLPNIHHKYAVLAIEALTMLFWFAGFIAFAVYINNPFITGCRADNNNSDPVCGTAKAAIAFGAFEWLAWLATLVLVVRALWNYRKSQGDPGAIAGNEGASYPMGVENSASQYPQPKHEGEGFPPSAHQPLEMPAPVQYGANNDPRSNV